MRKAAERGRPVATVTALATARVGQDEPCRARWAGAWRARVGAGGRRRRWAKHRLEAASVAVEEAAVPVLAALAAAALAPARR